MGPRVQTGLLGPERTHLLSSYLLASVAQEPPCILLPSLHALTASANSPLSVPTLPALPFPHFPVSLPDSWLPPCCISHTESNAITVSAPSESPLPPWAGSGLNNALPPPETTETVNSLPVEGGVPESHSWVTARAQEMSQKAGSWSPEGHPEDGLGSMTNSQTVEMREMGRMVTRIMSTSTNGRPWQAAYAPPQA
ncbi:voltage-dependent P/Q-type calcium channel subunit alpha-1A-like protein [Lates japonicus]|uniref:Voltage-dependent P/Q-type calcium channel subunit alpha-1A-like protein n=1 Tax=Lates japonicus TaxID=270547 RepID=A0AAD3MVZ4_LATJO|nr:voltage-dependent P/Q-type calcium channel subunit alpha-1A-like protein [Lates japonicus]